MNHMYPERLLHSQGVSGKSSEGVAFSWNGLFSLFWVVGWCCGQTRVQADALTEIQFEAKQGCLLRHACDRAHEQSSDLGTISQLKLLTA